MQKMGFFACLYANFLQKKNPKKWQQWVFVRFCDKKKLRNGHSKNFHQLRLQADPPKGGPLQIRLTPPPGKIERGKIENPEGGGVEPRGWVRVRVRFSTSTTLTLMKTPANTYLDLERPPIRILFTNLGGGCRVLWGACQ